MSADIQWFPGHMRKALREISEKLSLVDIVLETCDARIPYSSRNPELDSLIRNKRRIVVLNKSDLADDAETRKWIAGFHQNEIPAIPIDSIHKKGIQTIRKLILEQCADILEKARLKGRIGRPIRAMVVGIPNSGKSTLINSMCNRKMAVTGDRPGVTRGFQWARSDSAIELMDMPGVLWPKLGSRKNQLCLALTGAIKSEIMDIQTIALEGMNLIFSIDPKNICERYSLPTDDIRLNPEAEYNRFVLAAKNRGCILSGGRVDEERFAALFIDDFRSGRIGKISLEKYFGDDTKA